MHAQQSLNRVGVPALSHLLTDLANEVDGLVDMGITVCLIDEERMAGRHDFMNRRASIIRGLVKSIVDRHGTTALPTELISGSDRLLSAFASLEQFRSIRAESLRSVTDAVSAGWEDVHKSIRDIATEFGLIGENWYADVRERQDSYRSRLTHLFRLFSEAA